jgi:hypothetical protein
MTAAGNSRAIHAILGMKRCFRRGYFEKLRLTCFLLAVVLIHPVPSSPLAVILLNPQNWDQGRVPAGWHLKVNHGKPDFLISSDGGGSSIRLKSVDSSFGLERGVDVNPYETRYLTWSWKVTQLPASGDFRNIATDDQAAQLLVAFADRRVLTYIWDTTAPKGTERSAGFIPLARIFAIVCESGEAQTGRWVQEARDVAADYERAYGNPVPHVKGLRIQINSQHTSTVAESYFGEVAFRGNLP